jgi:hypothetical protein
MATFGYRIRLGPETDRRLHAAIAEVLAGRGGRHKRPWWSDRGPELWEPQRYKVADGRVTVTAELYEGTFLAGRRQVIEPLVPLIGQRLGRNNPPPWPGSREIPIGGQDRIDRRSEIRDAVLLLCQRKPGVSPIWVDESLKEAFEVEFHGIPLYYVDDAEFGPSLYGDEPFVGELRSRIERALNLTEVGGKSNESAPARSK